MDCVEFYLKIQHNCILETVQEPIFLLIDECQYDNDWSLTGKLIYDASKRIFMIFSGSPQLELSYNADSARRLLKLPILPLNYSQHLKLKYNMFNKDLSQSIADLIFDNEQSEIENIMNSYYSYEDYYIHEWEFFLKYGGFPSSINQYPPEILKTIYELLNKTLTIDIKNFKMNNDETLFIAFQLLYFIAEEKPKKISIKSLAETLKSDEKTITNLLDLLEKTKLIFHVKPYTASFKWTITSNKYYFATSSMKHTLSTELGNVNFEAKEYYISKLLENYVASSFFNLKNRNYIMYNIYYDSSENVDFLVQRGLSTPIPIEVSYGDKDTNQIRRAMKKYKSSHGIIISNTTKNIAVKEDIIYLPPQIFAFM